MADEKKNRFGADSFYCVSSSKGEAEEARQEAMKLDDDEDTIAGRWKGGAE